MRSTGSASAVTLGRVRCGHSDGRPLGRVSRSGATTMRRVVGKPTMAGMPILAVAAAGLAALVHVWFFALESLLFERPTVFGRFGLRSAEEAAIVRPMAFNQGFYNLFLAAGIVAGLGLTAAGQAVAGQAIVLFACACMVGAAVVLVSTNRRFLTAAAIQAIPPLVALLAALLLR